MRKERYFSSILPKKILIAIAEILEKKLFLTPRAEIPSCSPRGLLFKGRLAIGQIL